jgi:hypothetical protein
VIAVRRLALDGPSGAFEQVGDERHTAPHGRWWSRWATTSRVSCRTSMSEEPAGAVARRGLVCSGVRPGQAGCRTTSLLRRA